MDIMINFFANLSLYTVLPVVLTVLVGVVVVKAVLKLIDGALTKSTLDPAAVSLIKSLAKVVLFVLLGLIVAERLGVDVTGIVALASVASLALSLALQDALTNVIGGFTILSNHPFRTGDYVEIGGLAGSVEAIDITYTKLATPDKKVISIPNSAVVKANIINYSTSDTRRVDFNITASYDAPAATVKAALLKAAQVPGVLADPAPFVGLTNYGDHAIGYVLRVWVANADYWDVNFAINEKIKEEFDAAGVEMTYPHLNVHIAK